MGTDTTELSLATLELATLEACVELMFFTAYADGTVDPTERAEFEKHVAQATHGQLRPELVRAVLEQIEGRVKVSDRSTRVAALAQQVTDGRMRRAVLGLSAKVAMADGKLTGEERGFLAEVGAAFGLASEDVDQLIKDA